MGRGRAKAKQTKVARQLKYQTLGTDFDALQRELGGNEATLTERISRVDDTDAEDDAEHLSAAYAADPYSDTSPGADGDSADDDGEPARRPR
jgi:hypothetical protein